LVLGKQSIIEGIYVNASPNANIGRPMKVGKEELAGILAAVDLYLRQDHQALMRQYEDTVAQFVAAFDGKRPGIAARRVFPSEAGQPHPRALVDVDQAIVGKSIDHVVRELIEGDPSIAVSPGRTGIYLNPQTLQDEEVAIVIRRLRDVLRLR